MKATSFYPLLLLPTLALAQADRAGIGTTTPRAGLDVTHNDGIIATGALNSGNTDNLPTGRGSRMLWIPKLGAFRAGMARGDEWDVANIGRFSVALGDQTQASGIAATALGLLSSATGEASLALGSGSVASGVSSVALGGGVASGLHSVAVGNQTSTNGKAGSFAVGDNSASTPLLSGADNDFSARFAGGYRFFSNSATSQGLFLTPANRLRLGSSATAPRAGLDLSHDDGLVATGTPGQGNTADLPTGAGHRMLWIPRLGAFRAGRAEGDEWDVANIGPSSVAFGRGAQATRTASVAMGQDVSAVGVSSVAIGVSAVASGENSMALGWQTTASGTQSMALGLGTTASGNQSTALGSNASTHGKAGSFAVGDNSTGNLLLSSADHEFSARFAGGYRFFSNSATSQGLFLTPANRLRLGSSATVARAGLDLSHDDGLVATGTFNSGNTADLPTGAGVRLMWIPGKGALRAGGVSETQWDPSQVGNYSIALGQNTTASGAGAVALGIGTTASGLVSTALGSSASTNGKTGSFAVGDYSLVSSLNSSADNEFSARFAGGYRLFSNSAMTSGVFMAAGGNGWQVISDSTKKEGFRPANGAQFLQKIAGMRLGSWNYRGQDAATMRHWGPMAQDFFAAFGGDGVGTIGCDTLINQADFDGVNLIAIQALVRENDALKARLQALEADHRQATARNESLERTNERLERTTEVLRADVESIKRLLVANTGK